MVVLTRIARDGSSVVDESDRELVARAVRGERSAFAALYRRHATMVFGVLTSLVGPDREREDLMQDVFVRLHSALPRFRGDCSLTTLLYQLTSRTAIDHLRHRRRQPFALDDYDLDSEIDPQLSPADQAQRREQLASAVELIARLPAKQRVAFVLREVMDMPFDDIARVVGALPAATRMRVNAAKRALARHGRYS